MSPSDDAQPMNKLVEHMEKYHAPRGGNAYESTRLETVMRETGWSREEIFEMAMEAYDVGRLSVSIVSRGPRYAPDEWLPEDLRLIGVFAPL